MNNPPTTQTEADKQAIDSMTYTELLHMWRYEPSGHRYFQGELGKYYYEVMTRRKNELSPAEQISISKQLI